MDVGGKFGGNREDDYLAMNPLGLVPTLVEDDFTLWSRTRSPAICARSTVTARSARPTQGPGRRRHLDGLAADGLRAHDVPGVLGPGAHAEAERDHDAINAGIERGYKVWGVLDRHLADRAFVAGDTLTMGDIPIGPQAHRWLNLVEKRPPMPNLEGWYERLTERPAFGRT